MFTFIKKIGFKYVFKNFALLSKHFRKIWCAFTSDNIFCFSFNRTESKYLSYSKFSLLFSTKIILQCKFQYFFLKISWFYRKTKKIIQFSTIKVKASTTFIDFQWKTVIKTKNKDQLKMLNLPFSFFKNHDLSRKMKNIIWLSVIKLRGMFFK